MKISGYAGGIIPDKSSIPGHVLHTRNFHVDAFNQSKSKPNLALRKSTLPNLSDNFFT